MIKPPWLVRLSILGLGLFALSSCSLAGGLPEGNVTPIVPPARPAITVSPSVATTPAVVASPAAAQPAATPATLSTRQPSTGPASIVGTLGNGTSGAPAPGNVPLTLYALTPDQTAIMFTRTVTSDATGRFVFEQLDASPEILYGVQAQYQQAYYTSAPLTFAHGGLTLTAPITVYETTVDASGIRVEQMHLFLDFEPGRATVGELFIVSNGSDRAYLAADGTSLRLPLPPGATNVRFQDGELGGRYQPTSDGFADTEAVTPGPGAAQILVSYDLPYDGTKLDLNLTIKYPVRSVNVLAPESGVKLDSAQLTAAGVRSTQTGNMQNYVGGNLSAGQSLVLRLSGAANIAATSVASASGANISPALVIGAALLAVAAGVVAFVWLWRQRAAAELVEEQDPGARREELLDAIAALDDDFEAGRVPEADYRHERAALKAELVELMKDEHLHRRLRASASAGVTNDEGK